MFGWLRISRHLFIFNIINVILIALNIALWSHPPESGVHPTTAPGQDSDDVSVSGILDAGVNDERIPSTDNDYEKELQYSSLNSWLKRAKDSSKLARRLPIPQELNRGISKRNLTNLSAKRYATKNYTHGRDSGDPYRSYEVPKIEYSTLVNCDSLLSGDKRELERAEQAMMTAPKVPIYEETYLSWTEDCEQFKRKRGYVQMPLSREEEEFPLAFSITMFSDVEQVERLLRAIYQPQNFYCIHIDTKSSLLVHETVNSIAKCFDNVWVASHLDKIKWGDITVILLDVNCMRDLVKYYRGRYKYFINLTGQEFPLRTNLELVRIARIFNGSNDLAGSATRMDLDRVRYRWKHRWSKYVTNYL